MLKYYNKREIQGVLQFIFAGVLLHYDDATLKDLYFLDPQWLCDMLAHVVTIREINPFARTGIVMTEQQQYSQIANWCLV